MDPVLELLIRWALAALFGVAAVHKLADRRHFDGIVLDYRLLPPRLALRLARGLPWLELAVALGLLGGTTVAALVGAALLAGYGAAMAINLARGRRSIDCGCGGPAQPIGPALVVRNALLVATALTLLLPAGARPLGVLDFATVAAAVSALALLYAAAGELAAQAPWLRSLGARHD